MPKIRARLPRRGDMKRLQRRATSRHRGCRTAGTGGAGHKYRHCSANTHPPRAPLPHPLHLQPRLDRVDGKHDVDRHESPNRPRQQVMPRPAYSVPKPYGPILRRSLLCATARNQHSGHAAGQSSFPARLVHARPSSARRARERRRLRRQQGLHARYRHEDGQAHRPKPPRQRAEVSFGGHAFKTEDSRMREFEPMNSSKNGFDRNTSFSVYLVFVQKT